MTQITMIAAADTTATYAMILNSNMISPRYSCTKSRFSLNYILLPGSAYVSTPRGSQAFGAARRLKVLIVLNWLELLWRLSGDLKYFTDHLTCRIIEANSLSCPHVVINICAAATNDFHKSVLSVNSNNIECI